MWIIELLVVLFFIWLGARIGSIGIGFAGGFGVLVLGLVFGLKPGAIPTDVILIIMSVIAAIAAMQLTFEDMGAWMQEQGLNFGLPAGAAGGQAGFGNMSEEERAAMRATAQAGGGFGGEGRPFGNMSEEEREAMRATAEASGMTFPGAGAPGVGAGAGRGQLAVLAEQVVELLTERAAE